MTLEIQVLAWDRHKNVVGLNACNSVFVFSILSNIQVFVDSVSVVNTNVIYEANI